MNIMQKFFKKLTPIISLSMLVGIGCRKQDEFFPGNPHHRAEKFDSYVAQSLIPACLSANFTINFVH